MRRKLVTADMTEQERVERLRQVQNVLADYFRFIEEHQFSQNKVTISRVEFRQDRMKELEAEERELLELGRRRKGMVQQ